MSKQLFGKIDNYKGQKVYTGVSTNTADVIVNNQSNGISVNVKSKGIFDKVSATAQQLQPEQLPSVDVQQTAGGGLNFDFGIPKGEPGQQGEKGKKGDKGDTGPQGPRGYDGSIALADFYDNTRLYKFNDICSYNGLMYLCLHNFQVEEQFNPEHWRYIKLVDYSLWRYIQDNHRYILRNGIPTYQANTVYHARCASVPCRIGDVFYYTGMAHYNSNSQVYNYWVLDSAGHIVDSFNAGNTMLYNKEINIIASDATKILFNFCTSTNVNPQIQVYPYEITTQGILSRFYKINN